jgi:deoxycytidylate deaminase
MRSSWDETWLAIANTISKRSKCVNRQVGAVIVDQNNRPVAVGYNGPPANFDAVTDCSGFCPRSGSQNRGGSYDNCVSVHAEANALLFADRRLFKAATIYVTNPCCWDCAKLIANSGITKVIMEHSAADSHATWDHVIELFEQCKIEITTIEREENDA